MGALPIITADQRMAERRGIKGVLVGPVGIGKTSQLWTLDPATTLFVDMEAGDLAVEGWPGDTIRPRTWQECRDIAVYIGGPNPALRDDQSFSDAHYQAVVAKYGDPAVLSRYETLFLDSLTVGARLCMQWCKGQPQVFSDKTGKPDLRGAYGLLGQEMINWLVHLQHTRNKNVWFVGILDKKIDDFNRPYFALQLEGSKTGLELPGIVDEVVTLTELKAEDGGLFRAFVCHTMNPWGFPAKDRSGRLAMVEEPHLGRLMAKISGPARPIHERLEYGQPAPAETVTPASN
ncbi:MAG: ATP-binding protein [Magnetococcales bacterium]|nr:ATP-binding protein [Magnetococcales bacterium]